MKLDLSKDEGYWMGEFHRGNEQALGYFFQLHTKSLIYFTSRLLQDQAEAQDIVSDCFIKLWKRYHDFETAQNIKAFLYISCRNACLDHLAHLKVKSTAQQAFLRELESGEETILLDIIRSEAMDLLTKEIELLPDIYRQVFERIYFEGKKTDEIALELGLSVKTVRNYKANAVELLKSSFLKKGISGAMYLALLLLLEGY